LGLSICQELLKAHGSHLEVRSVPQEGSVFSFDLPVSTAPAVAGTSKLLKRKGISKISGRNNSSANRKVSLEQLH